MAQLHSTLLANHRPYAAVYADAAERLAATGFVRVLGGDVAAFDSTDLYKKALQLDDASEWILTATTPTWTQVSGAGALANDSVTNALLANMAQSTIKGRAAGAGTGDPTDLTATQATAILNAMVGDSGAGGTKGLVPAPAAGDAAANKFLKADGAWEAPSGGGDIAPLVVENANTVAQRNGTTAQTFNLYRTFTDVSNYERLRLGWGIIGGNDLQLIAEKAGTGSNRAILLVSSAGGVANGSLTWTGEKFYPSGNFTQDIGFPAGNRFNRIDGKFFTANDYYGFDGGTRLQSTGSGSGNDNILKLFGAFRNGGTITGGAETPSTITADQDNYSQNASLMHRWSSNASRTVTGMVMAGNIAGMIGYIWNVGANDIVLAHESASSTDANRWLTTTGANLTIGPNRVVMYMRDGTVNRWRVTLLP